MPLKRHYVYSEETAMSEFSDQDFVDYVVKAIVNNPEAVSSERTIDERGVLITLKVDQRDMGTVIGREGKTVVAIRKLLKVVGAKNNARVNLKIYEPEGSRRAEAPSDLNSELNIVDDFKI